MIPTQSVQRGDRFVMPHPDADKSPWFIEVTRVSKAGTWADIRVLNWAVMWTKRMPEGIPADWKRQSWTMTDVDAYVPALARKPRLSSTEEP